MLLILTNFYFKTHLSAWRQSGIVPLKVVDEGTLLFLGVLAVKYHHLFFCVGIQMDYKCHNCLRYGLISVLELTFRQNNGFPFFFQRVNPKLSICFGKSLIQFGAWESWLIRNAKKCFYFWHTWFFKFICILLSSFLHQGISPLFFYLRLTIFFWVSKNFFSTSELECSAALCGKSAISIDLSRCSFLTFSKRTALDFAS